MNDTSDHNCLDNYYWRKKGGKKRIKTRWCRTSSSIKYCHLHKCKGAHAIVPRLFNKSGNRIQDPSEICNNATDLIKFNSRKSIKKFQRIMNKCDNKGYVCHCCKNGVRKSYKGYINELKKEIEKDYRKLRRDKVNHSDVVFQGREAYLARKNFLNKRSLYHGDEVCGICMNEMNGRIVEETACGHLFCKTCFDCLKDYNLRENFYQRYTLQCPLCRGNIFSGKPAALNITN